MAQPLRIEPSIGWSSPTVLYLAERLRSLGALDEDLRILDMGCGPGKPMGELLRCGFDVWGCDLTRSTSNPELEKTLQPYFGDDVYERVHLTQDERVIPFPDDSFDIVYTNQVFEHVRFLDCVVSECARVTRPGGVLLANFPLATYLLEGHVRVPLVHWIPPGRFRQRYLRAYQSVFAARRRQWGIDAAELARRDDDYLREQTFYRFYNEVRAIFLAHYTSVEVDTSALIDAKLALSSGWKAKALRRVRSPLADALATHLVNAAFIVRGPVEPRVAQPLAAGAADSET